MIEHVTSLYNVMAARASLVSFPKCKYHLNCDINCHTGVDDPAPSQSYTALKGAEVLSFSDPALHARSSCLVALLLHTEGVQGTLGRRTRSQLHVCILVEEYVYRNSDFCYADVICTMLSHTKLRCIVAPMLLPFLSLLNYTCMNI